MIKFEMLEKLEKEIDRKKADNLLRYGDYLIDIQKEKDNSRHRIVELDGRTYYHGMKDGETIHCFEIAESWKPFNNVIVWKYTPDDFHRIQIDSRCIWEHEVCDLPGRNPVSGEFFYHNENIVVFADNDHIRINGKEVKVLNNFEYTYSFKNKRHIKARDGASGLYCFMENISFSLSDALYSSPLFISSLDQMIEIYG